MQYVGHIYTKTLIVFLFVGLEVEMRCECRWAQRISRGRVDENVLKFYCGSSGTVTAKNYKNLNSYTENGQIVWYAK